jgi:hypothetical protein
MNEYPLADVLIFKAGTTYRVRPAYLVTTTGRKIVFRNLTDAPVRLFFPARDAFSKTELSIERSGTNDVDVTGNVAGLYPYAAYSEEAGDFVVGESSPGIIIER